MYLLIEGDRPLKGTVTSQGAKNSAVHLIAASLLTKDEVILENVPLIDDIYKMAKILEGIGSCVQIKERDHIIYIKPGVALNPIINDPLASELRASLSFVGALLSRIKEASLIFPGGCNIGIRPVDFHLKGFSLLGAQTSLEHGVIIAKAKRLTGNRIYLDYPSVGATINLILASCLAHGETILENVAEEPEVQDLCNMLNEMGGKIKGTGTKSIFIRGVRELHGVRHKVIPDRIEGGTYLIAGCISKGEITLKDTIPQHLEPLVVKLSEAGAEVEVAKTKILVRAKNKLQGVTIKTMPYPGFPTDLQNQMIPLLCLAEGASFITETVFENRFLLIPELRKMGANIKGEGQSILITGVDHLTGTKVSSPNLRGAASLVLAALGAQGCSEVHDIEHLDRGYEKMEEKLTGLGAKIRRIPSERKENDAIS